MKVSPIILVAFFILGLVSGFAIGSIINIHTTTIVSVVEETKTLEKYSTIEKTVTVVKSATTSIIRETFTDTVTLTITRNFNKNSRDGDISCIIFKTSKDVYKISEEVVLVLENRCDYILVLPNPAPWMILDAHGEIVYSPIAIQVITEVKTGDVLEWSWNQKDAEGRKTAAGKYYAKLTILNAGVLNIEFTIIEN